MPRPTLFPLSTFPSQIPETIRFNDLDPLGHLNNNAIGIMIESGRVDLLTPVGIQFRNTGETIVIAHLATDFIAQGHYPATLTIGSAIEKIGGSSFTIIGQVMEGDTCLAQSRQVCVYFDMDTNKPCPIPTEIRQNLEKLYLKETR